MQMARGPPGVGGSVSFALVRFRYDLDSAWSADARAMVTLFAIANLSTRLDSTTLLRERVRRGRSRGRRYGVSSSSVQSAGIHRLRSTRGAPNPRLLNLNKATKRHFASSWP
jgi:hypothetical protein